MERSVDRVITAARHLEGGGFPVRRPFPGPELDQVDPFLLLDHLGPVDWGPGEAVGAPEHPHAGFETVTYLLEGSMEHGDSRGNRGLLRPGDIQWMTAGSGLVHSEVPEKEFLRAGGRMHGFQLWVNLPASDKDIPPRYQDMRAEDIPEGTTADRRSRVRVIAGEALGQRAQTETRIPITYLHVTVQPQGTFVQPVDPGHNVAAYIFGGQGLFGPEPSDGHRPERVEVGQLVLFGRDGDLMRASAPAQLAEPLEFLLLAGSPLEEPVVRMGPFVATSRERLRQIAQDYQTGRLG